MFANLYHLDSIESIIHAAGQGQLDEQSFWDKLSASRLYLVILSDDAAWKQNIDPYTTATPLTQVNNNGIESIVAFSRKSYAKRYSKQQQDFDCMLEVKFSFLMEKLASGYGISINPGQKVGLELIPDCTGKQQLN